MLVVNRYRVVEAEQPGLLDDLGRALEVLSVRPGYRSGRAGRSTDDPALWVMVTEWESVGAYRRALGAYEVKLHVHPLMYRAVDEPSAFEVLLEDDGEGLVAHASDLADAPAPGPLRDDGATARARPDLSG